MTTRLPYSICLALLGAAPGLPAQEPPLRIVTSLTTYGVIAREIAGDRAEVTSIARGDENPHFVQPRPSYVLDLKRANLFITTGLDLELWVPTLLDKAGNPRIREGSPGYLAVYGGIDLLDVPASVSRSGGDIHAFGNPHLWTDPVNGIIIADNIRNALRRLDPPGAAEYDRRYADFRRRVLTAYVGEEVLGLLGEDAVFDLARRHALRDFLTSQQYQGRPLADRVAGWARLPGAPLRYLRVDLPATVLAAQRRSLRVLFPVALAASAAALLLVVLFVRRAFAPYDALLRRARAAGAVGEGQEDEVTSLVLAFERALAALARPVSSPEDDIAALERALAPSLESGLLLLDREGGVIALNPTGADILDVAPPAPGTPLAGAFPSVPQVAQALAPALAAGTALSRQEVDFVRRGERRRLGFTLHPLRRDDGGVRGHLALFVDLTTARREEEENRIASSLAQLGELTAGLAHELRNSLATLRGYLALIERRPEEERIADYLSEIRRETDQLQRVLEDFLSFARPGSARLEDTALEVVVRRAAADPALRGTAIEIVEDSAPLPRVQADPQLLERAVRNLLHNAVEAELAGGSPGPVVARLAAVAAGVELRIEDRGPGLTAEIRGRLFQPFASDRPGGVGLGLALAHRILTLHGGRLQLEDRPGGGTRAVVHLSAPPPDLQR